MIKEKFTLNDTMISCMLIVFRRLCKGTTSSELKCATEKIKSDLSILAYVKNEQKI